jgi:NSS family neurotransmitter:Na+ symporter
MSGQPGALRESFTSRFGALMSMIGVAIGLGNVWRFPYMVGEFGGAAFVLFYLVVAILIGVPALMAEWALGRHTRRGPVGAFAAGGLPLGRIVGWFFFCIVIAAMGYYSAVIGWVLYFALGQAAVAAGMPFSSSAILPPDTGFAARSFALQLICTAVVVTTCALVVRRGVRGGIERLSRIIMPGLFVALLLLAIRSLTLPGSLEGVRWYVLKFEPADLNPRVMLAAMGQAFFSLSLGGTYMVIYGSYLSSRTRLGTNALLTAGGDTLAGLLAGFVIFPAVFALGLEPTSGPGLLFSTLPQVFAGIPLGGLFGLIFFLGLFAAALLSDVAALEVLAAGLTDNTRMERGRAVWLLAAAVFLCSLPPTTSMRVFLPWDLTFGSGVQAFGSLLAIVTLGWCVRRSAALAELSSHGESPVPNWLFNWIRYGIPLLIVAVFAWWLLTSVLGVASDV